MQADPVADLVGVEHVGGGVVGCRSVGVVAVDPGLDVGGQLVAGLDPGGVHEGGLGEDVEQVAGAGVEGSGDDACGLDGEVAFEHGGFDEGEFAEGVGQRGATTGVAPRGARAGGEPAGHGGDAGGPQVVDGGEAAQFPREAGFDAGAKLVELTQCVGSFVGAEAFEVEEREIGDGVASIADQLMIRVDQRVGLHVPHDDQGSEHLFVHRPGEPGFWDFFGDCRGSAGMTATADHRAPGCRYDPSDLSPIGSGSSVSVTSGSHGSSWRDFLLRVLTRRKPMALDARHRSSIYGRPAPVLGEEDANALMTEFPSVEADELVTRQFLRAELAELRGELTGEFAGVRGEIAGVRAEMAELRTDLTLRMIAAIGAATAVLGTLNVIG